MKKKTKKISAEELDKKFDDGKEDVLEHFDLKNAKVVPAIQRINHWYSRFAHQIVDRPACRPACGLASSAGNKAP